MITQTASQTIGPFFHSLLSDGENVLVNEQASGERIIIEGRMLDGAGQPVQDALIEIWQADANGIYNHPADRRREGADPAFRGFGRSATGEEGTFWLKTVKPGRVPSGDGPAQAPHINVRIFARGMLIHAVTRLYFADETANESDPVLSAIVEPERRQTLIAQREQSEDLPRYCFDIVLQGERETLFFDA